jgi:hypothetical protein
MSVTPDKCSLPPVFAVWRPRNQRWDFLKPVRHPRTGRLLRISTEWRPWTRSVLTTPTGTDTSTASSATTIDDCYEDVYRPRPPSKKRPASAGPRKRIPLDPSPLTYRRTAAYFTVWELEDRGIVSYQVPILVFDDWRVLPRMGI